MTVDLKPEQERLIGQAIQAGLIGTAEEIVAVGVEAIRQRLQSSDRDIFPAAPASEDWEREFDAWVASFPDTVPLPDEALQRESMYPDRF